jgi:anti-sigma B factor antagonist
MYMYGLTEITIANEKLGTSHFETKYLAVRAAESGREKGFRGMLMAVNVTASQLGYLSWLMPNTNLELEKLPFSNETLTVYQAKGKLSLETVNEFIQKLRPESAQHLVLDLNGVTFLDSAGVGSLVSLFVSRRNQAKTFALAGLSQQGKAVVTVAGLHNLLPIYNSIEEATAAAAKKAGSA